MYDSLLNRTVEEVSDKQKVIVTTIGIVIFVTFILLCFVFK
jgi:hypothetical protein